jgi:hypothetical protein
VTGGDIAVFQMNAGDWSEILEMPDVVDAGSIYIRSIYSLFIHSIYI